MPVSYPGVWDREEFIPAAAMFKPVTVQSGLKTYRLPESMAQQKLRQLPLGTSTFTEIRRFDQIYVDKTDLVCRMASTRGKFFLARPRRFGKSLLVSTFESLFRDGLEYFGGLAAEKIWEDPADYSVVSLDFSEAADFRDINGFRSAFAAVCRSAFEPVGFRYDREYGSTVVEQVSSWMRTLPGSSLVLLIDEYDAPLTAAADPGLFSMVRAELSRFFRVVKTREGCLRFFFMTGVTKFQNAGIFSAFNNLTDISLMPAYGTLLGYTEGELLNCFSDWLDEAVARAGYRDRDSLVAAMRQMYDGFCFDARASTHVYAPWSVLSFLANPAMGLVDYWYSSSGRPALLMRYLERHHLDSPENYAGEKSVFLEELNASGELDAMNPYVLLTQAGYLTIKSVSPDGLTAVLDYPNREVATSVARLYSSELLRGSVNPAGILRDITGALSQGDLDRLAEALNGLLLCIDYKDHTCGSESSLRAVVQVVLISCGLKPRIEVHNACGRSDLEVVCGRYHWVLEFKIARCDREIQDRLAEGVSQLRERRYGLSQPEGGLIRAAMVCSASGRRFAAWQKDEEPVSGCQATGSAPAG